MSKRTDDWIDQLLDGGNPYDLDEHELHDHDDPYDYEDEEDE